MKKTAWARARQQFFFLLVKTNGDVAGAVRARLTFDEFLCFKEEEARRMEK